mgnify:CR=1 FL=1
MAYRGQFLGGCIPMGVYLVALGGQCFRQAEIAHGDASADADTAGADERKRRLFRLRAGLKMLSQKTAAAKLMDQRIGNHDYILLRINCHQYSIETNGRSSVLQTRLAEECGRMPMLAADRGISVNSTERDMIRLVTDEYMNSLSEADLSYIGCDRNDVQTLYTDYYTAEKLINSITETVDTEISDSEVKVIKIAEIATSDLKKAKAILKRIKIDGESFSSMASRYTETDTIEQTLMRSNTPDLIERTAFSLEEGQTSNILAEGDMYYIINCVDGYAESETLERKERLSKALNTKAVREILDPYRAEHNIKFVNRFWNDMDFSEPSGSSVSNFFDVYDKIIG